MKEVLKQIAPSKKEHSELKKTAKEIINKLNIPNTKIILGGSSAKNTYLKENNEIDLYVKFNLKKYQELDISNILKENLKKNKLKFKTLHGSRDYYHVQKGKFTIELIPILNITKPEQARNITDISPFHSKWVNKFKLNEDIRLAKAFAKANGFYGAESYIKGFSGYSLEILTIHYKGFNNLLKSVSKWKTKTVIDPEKWYKGNPLNFLNKSKTLSPLVIVDPVQDTRNVTAVVSVKKYKLFIKTAKSYLKKPNQSFFFKEPFSLEKIKQKHKKHNLITINLQPLEGKQDVVGAKLLKVHNFIEKKIKKHDFSLKHSGWHWQDTALLYFIIENIELSKNIKHYGPPTTQKDRLKHFKETWKSYKVKTEKGISYVTIPRKYLTPEELVKDLLTQEYISTRIDKVI
jgi:tRNA nucleotidyltransferase (CCA-adding enzyme)